VEEKEGEAKKIFHIYLILNRNMRTVPELIKVPPGLRGQASFLEPLAKDFPQFGSGGATQAITEKAFRVRRIVDLRTGKIIYER
jgi:hypothetical protein